jgi:hypothetical protein
MPPRDLPERQAGAAGLRGHDTAAQTPPPEPLPVDLFQAIMDGALLPLANPVRQPSSFFDGYRLVGVDCLPWAAGDGRGARRRLQRARVCLVRARELGTLAPLAVVAVQADERLPALLRRLWARIPERSLVIGDRLPGGLRTLGDAQRAWMGRDIQGLFRVRRSRGKLQERLPDGSTRITIRAQKGCNGGLEARDICAEGLGGSGKRHGLRLWTTLRDAERHPAAVLARHYAQRWEAQLRHLDTELDPMAGHGTPLDEIAALIVASAEVARLRSEAVPGPCRWRPLRTTGPQALSRTLRIVRV